MTYSHLRTESSKLVIPSISSAFSSRLRWMVKGREVNHGANSINDLAQWVSANHEAPTQIPCYSPPYLLLKGEGGRGNDQDERGPWFYWLLCWQWPPSMLSQPIFLPISTLASGPSLGNEQVPFLQTSSPSRKETTKSLYTITTCPQFCSEWQQKHRELIKKKQWLKAEREGKLVLPVIGANVCRYVRFWICEYHEGSYVGVAVTRTLITSGLPVIHIWLFLAITSPSSFWAARW